MSSTIVQPFSHTTAKLKYTGTGAAGVKLSGEQPKDVDANKVAPAPRPSLVVGGDSIKCNIVHGHLENKGAIRFEGKSKSTAPLSKKLEPELSGSKAAVTVVGTMKLSNVAESMSTMGMVFKDDDDE